MNYKLEDGTFSQIDEDDLPFISGVLKKGCHWHCNKITGQVVGWCMTKRHWKKFSLARVVMRCWNGNLDVDHINHDQLDNRKENLRVCAHQENCFNTRLRANNTSGYKGVHWRVDKNKFCARIRTKEGRLHLGYFASSKEAAIAYNNAAIKYHGVFAKLNAV